MTKKYKLIFIIMLMLLVFGILVVFVFDVNCLFKTVFAIPCPSCGLTRGFRSLFEGNIIAAFNYNILTIPLFLFLVIFLLLFLIDILKKSNYLEKYLNFFIKYYYLIILLIIISFIINLLKI